MEDSNITMIGQVREVLNMLIDKDTFVENSVCGHNFAADFGCGAIVGTGEINGNVSTIIANDTDAYNEKFPVVFAGIIGLEEAYKMAQAVYITMEADRTKDIGQKRPIVLIVDTPGNAPGKIEEIIGMNKATGAYQLALAEARGMGHPIIAVVIGRAISGAFLCHGLQADHILALSKDFGTIIHVMPLTSIARITKMDIEELEKMSVDNPVFASGVDFFYKLGGIDEIIYTLTDMKRCVADHIEKIRILKAEHKLQELGPKGRGLSGLKRNGRNSRAKAMDEMKKEYSCVIRHYLSV
ncbi:biotin-independent malonate decarboxylase subunit gamma [Cloacibacillus sp. An23]|uniref:biotin-independent malonate decarboxylase subunit gamma n=1 Tax=Cloacibacillus sp. An23 TaxID=1965591 RepID=UPI000B39ECD5|nr:biotin-independent malonate decarboxylase subunit gamma [Cloacibacillus sp. An23]OUO92973.1 biotin-independent malonate decarboxylase subunit gamma [Cloacibacillus sp. An23]